MSLWLLGNAVECHSKGRREAGESQGNKWTRFRMDFIVGSFSRMLWPTGGSQNSARDFTHRQWNFQGRNNGSWYRPPPSALGGNNSRWIQQAASYSPLSWALRRGVDSIETDFDLMSISKNRNGISFCYMDYLSGPRQTGRGERRIRNKLGSSDSVGLRSFPWSWNMNPTWSNGQNTFPRQIK